MTSKDELKTNARKLLTNKYLIAILVFAVVYLLVGDQSAIKRLKRSRQIHQTEVQLRKARADTQHALHLMEVLQDTDSLEQFARERYGMHASNEDVYLITN